MKPVPEGYRLLRPDEIIPDGYVMTYWPEASPNEWALRTSAFSGSRAGLYVNIKYAVPIEQPEETIISSDYEHIANQQNQYLELLRRILYDIADDIETETHGIKTPEKAKIRLREQATDIYAFLQDPSSINFEE